MVARGREMEAFLFENKTSSNRGMVWMGLESYLTAMTGEEGFSPKGKERCEVRRKGVALH